MVIAARKEKFVLDDRARNCSAEFVHFERSPPISIGLVGVCIRVQGLVAEHVAPLSMKLIRAGFRGHGNYALPSPIFGAEVIADDANFLQSFGVRNDGGFVVASAHHWQTVELDIVRKRAATVDTDGRELPPPIHSDSEGIRACRAVGGVARLNAGLQKRIVERILRNVRNSLYRRGIKRSADAGRLSLELRRTRANLHQRLNRCHHKLDVYTNAL